jgi:phage terminase large subunit-like protein
LSPVSSDALVRGDGVLVREFIAAKGKITKDSVAGRTGEPLRLRPWQESLVDHIFARRADGRRLHRVHLVGLPRKQGKTALAAVIALYGLTMEGQGAEVYSCAADKDQSKLVFGAAKRMVELDEELSARLTLYRDTIEDRATGSFYRALSSEAYTKEGLSPTMVVYDELHAAPNRDLFDVMSLAMGARPEPLLLAITTAGQRSDPTGQDSVAFSLYQYGRRVATKEQQDASFGFAWWEAPTDADHRDPRSWPKANPALGDLTDAEDYASALLRTPEAEFRTKRMNQWVNSATSWLPTGAWDRLHEGRTVQDGEQVVLAFDGSFSGDCTAIVACTLDGFLQPVALWERPLDDPHWQVPMDDVEAKMYDLCKKYQVREIAADPYRWARTLQKWETDGLPVTIYPQNPARMVPACAAFYEAVVQETLTHSGDAAMSRHLDNCSVKIDRFGPRVVKEHRGSARKIDLAVCGIMAYDRARYHAQSPASPKAAEFITL